ncbi:MAG: hypothetical protein ACR2LI_08220 [Propionibacteriaceae bacterium]
MVDPYQLTLGVIAVVIMIGVPLLCVAVFDLLVGDWEETKLRWKDHSLFRRRRPLRRKGPPLEKVAADLRRLRAELTHDEGRSAAHQLGSRMAYDVILKQACGMLGVEHELDQETVGIERDLERFRIEAVLESVGVVLTQYPPGQSERHGQTA